MEEEEEELYFTYRQHQDSSRRSWQAISTRKTRTTWKTLRWEITNTSECFIICICKPLVMFRTLKKTKNNLTLSPESPGLPGGPEAPGGPGRPYFKQKTSFNFYIYTQYNTIQGFAFILQNGHIQQNGICMWQYFIREAVKL